MANVSVTNTTKGMTFSYNTLTKGNVSMSTDATELATVVEALTEALGVATTMQKAMASTTATPSTSTTASTPTA